MTLPSSLSKALFHGNGITTQFPFHFKVWNKSQLEVSVTSASGDTAIATNWDVLLTETGGTVTYTRAGGTPLPQGWKLAILRSMPFRQGIDLISGTRFDSEVVETQLDQATAERQQLREALGRAVILDPTSEITPIEMAKQLLEARDRAEASAAGAEVARAGAETAQAGAELARAESQSAQALAQAAQALAEKAKDGAQAAQAGLEVARAAAEAAAQSAHFAKRAAEAAKLGAQAAHAASFEACNRAEAAARDANINLTTLRLNVSYGLARQTNTNIGQENRLFSLEHAFKNIQVVSNAALTNATQAQHSADIAGVTAQAAQVDASLLRLSTSHNTAMQANTNIDHENRLFSLEI